MRICEIADVANKTDENLKNSIRNLKLGNKIIKDDRKDVNKFETKNIDDANDVNKNDENEFETKNIDDANDVNEIKYR
jgi:hypothetical protein